MTESRSVLALDAQLCFALHAASRAMTATYRAGLADLGLTYSQFLVMLVLWEDGPVTLSALSARLYLDSGTLSPLVHRLQRHGLVDRTRGSADGRTIEVAATPAGAALRPRAAAVAADVRRAAGLAPARLSALRDQLRELTGSLRELDAAPDGV